MWPFTSKRASMSRMSDAIERLERNHSALREQVEDLNDRHNRLRGRVYQAGIHKTGLTSVDGAERESATVPSASSPLAHLTKDELRKRAGIIPGRPYRHPASNEQPTEE